MSDPSVVNQQIVAAIPTPPTFPVAWESQAEANKFWMQGAANFPTPITPLDFTFFVKAVERGSNLAAAHYDSPDRGLFKLINAFAYFTVESPPDAPEVRAKRQAAVDRVEDDMVTTGQRWTEAWLPEIQQHLAFWDTFDLEGASAEALVAHIEETEQRLLRAWEIHFLLINPVLLALHLFEEMHHDLFPDAPALAAHELLLGFENKNVEGNRHLAALIEQARTHEEIRQALALESGEVVAATQSALMTTPAGRAFHRDLQVYLALYGQRSNSQTLHMPAWLEEPGPVFQHLRAGLDAGESSVSSLAALAARRDQRLTQVRAELSGHPPMVVAKFEELLSCAQTAQQLSEDHNYWIDIQVTYRIRRICLAVARRLVSGGKIDRVEDVFYLTLDELRQAASPGSPLELRERISARQAEARRFQFEVPPPVLGTPPSPEEMAAMDNALARAYGKMAGGVVPATGDTDQRLFRGFGVSSGKAKGPVKVVTTLEDAAKRLVPGDVLVTEMITSYWIPLYPRIAGLITMRGGMLSHGAVVAREHGLPAISGVQGATSLLQEGHWVELDADAGEIRVLDSGEGD